MNGKPTIPAGHVSIPRPSPNRAVYRALVDCEIDVRGGESVADEDLDALVDYLNELSDWCKLPGTIVPR